MLQQNVEIHGCCKVGRPPFSEEVAETCGVQRLECRLQEHRQMVWSCSKETERANNETVLDMEATRHRPVRRPRKSWRK